MKTLVFESHEEFINREDKDVNGVSEGVGENEMNIKRPVLRYHGGKWLLAKWIVSFFPPHRIYTEVFGGAASVLMQKERSYAEVYNDRWDRVVNVFRVLRDKEMSRELEKLIRLTPFSRTEFYSCSETEMRQITDPVELARRTILRSFAGFGSASTNGKYATGFRSNSNRSGTTPAHDWVNYPGQITSFCERLQGVVIENRDYKEILIAHDSENTLHFLDPPYVHSTRNMKRGNAAYEHELTDKDHVELTNIIKRLKGYVVLAGYDNDIYNDCLSGFRKVERKAFADGARERMECLWLSPNIKVNSSKQLSIYEEENV